MNSQKEKDSANFGWVNGVTAVDWLEIAACVKWHTTESKGWFDTLEDAKTLALSQRDPVTIPFGNDIVVVEPRGMGAGKDSHLEYSLKWKGVSFGFSARDEATRQLHNARVSVPGQPCLLVGWGTSWQRFEALVALIGGEIEDQWIRRLDLCIDLPDVSFQDDFLPILDKKQYVTSAKKGGMFDDKGVPTGFAKGNSARSRIQIYDKFWDTLHNHDSVYFQGMVEHRWNGKLPRKATRVEYQIGRAWFSQFGLKDAKSVMLNLPQVFAKLTGGKRSMFRLVAGTPDRKNNHQSRQQTHPLWSRIVEIGTATIGATNETLKRIERTNLDERAAAAQVVGYLTSVADRSQSMCVTKDDALRILSDLMERHQITDDYIEGRFLKKARSSGTWQDLLEFPGKEAA